MLERRVDIHGGLGFRLELNDGSKDNVTPDRFLSILNVGGLEGVTEGWGE